MMFAHWIVRFDGPDEICRDQFGPLMDQLIERVLSIGSRLAPNNWSGGIINERSVARHTLAIALHVSLLEVGRQTVQVLIVRQDGMSLSPEKIVVPNPQQTEDHRQIFLQRRRAEML